MSKTFAANAGDSGLASFLLLYIAFPTPLRICNADFDIITASGAYPAGGNPGAHTWYHNNVIDPTGRYFSIPSMSLNSADTVGPDEIHIDNGDNYLSAILFSAGAGVGVEVQVYQALFPMPITSALPDDLKFRLLRVVETVKLVPDPTKREAVLTLAPYRDFQAMVIPRRHLSPQCTFTFKETHSCQYVGADTSCTRTKADCTSKANTAHFGGFETIAGKAP